MSAARPRRLPGFRFETVAPTLPETLPRMDIAVFVGFAASGPLEMPVACESEAQFTAIFGQDAPLAWDVEKGVQIYAYLAPAVRAFFRNGGQRCWVIRVARRESRATNKLNRAACNYFPIPSLACIRFDNEKITRIAPAFALARSEGSWSDSILVGTALLAQPAQVNGSVQFTGAEYVLYLNRDSSAPVVAGELLRLNFKQGSLFLTVSKVELPPLSSPPADAPNINSILRVTAKKAAWMSAPKAIPPPGTQVTISVFTHEPKSADVTGIDPGEHFKVEYKAIVNPDLVGSPPSFRNEPIRLKILKCAVENAPGLGSVIEIAFGSDRLLMTVNDLSFSSDAAASPLISGQPVLIRPVPQPLPETALECQRLSFELWVRKAEEYAVSLSDLGFDASHARFWATLPSDEEIYSHSDEVLAETPATILWRQVGDLFRFPLAGVRGEAGMYLPLAMLATPDNYLGPIRLQGNELERDGLAEFDANLFMDSGVATAVTENLSSEAEFISYLAPKPRGLTGMHAAFALEEATIIAIPDAVHPGWIRRAPQKLQKPEPSDPPVRPEWWHFLDCNAAIAAAPAPLSDCDPKPPPPSSKKSVHEPEWGQFLDCAIRIIEAPVLVTSTQLSADGTFTLSWSSAPEDGQVFVLEESGEPNFSSHEEIYSGKLTKYTIYGRKDGDYYYRVRAITSDGTSDWSNGVVVRVGATGRWALISESKYSPAELYSVQRALLRMCAARGDLLGVLSLPKHYREDKAIEHVRTLKSIQVISNALVPPLGSRETNTFSYGAVFHPWLVSREQPPGDGLRSVPPCGAMCGVIAKRALRRGAWLAPANEPLVDVLALEPTLARAGHLDMQEAHINLLRKEPRGFLVLDADTLSDDVDLRSINVRRLLILLRRQALRLGASYVFEPNNDAFRRVVERGFTEMLDGMFERGAFAGSTPASSYQVVAGPSLNTPESVEQGRFIVELRVAPSLPLSFLTIRLIQTSDRSLAMEVR